ncbi:MAG: dihydropteroate synthase [Treponema sp.]|nr:dihydropteroate synthase [Treponema sp.]
MTRRIELPGGNPLDLCGPALIMAVVNCTADSFYAPSRAMLEDAVEKALRAEEEGASIIDFGGESSRPGSLYVSEEEELERVIPVVNAFRKRSSLPVSVDTRKAAVARAALDAGADIINDISALCDDPLMPPLCAGRGAAVVLMHKKGVPLTMQEAPLYGDVVAEVGTYLKAAAERAIAAGIPPGKIIVDPGIGFGKRLQDNLELIRRLPCLAEICGNDYPVLVGLSRKNFIGEITGRDVPDRLWGTLAANAAAVMGGAAIIRLHDVPEHLDMVKTLFALRTG